MKVWWIDWYLESHRHPEHGATLAEAFGRCGIEAVRDFSDDCQLVFCGSIERLEQLQAERHRTVGLPTILYHWDLYPFQLRGPQQELWADWLMALHEATEVWVPSRCTAERTAQYIECRSRFMPAAVRPFVFTGIPHPSLQQAAYILDPMRAYREPDHGAEMLDNACRDLGIPLIRTGCTQKWSDFQAIVAGARLLVSPNHEASTGSLTLLEGYQLGKSILASNSRWNGAVEYFGGRATYFQWNDPASLRRCLAQMWESPGEGFAQARRSWVLSLYSDDAFARRAAQRFRELVR